MLEALAACAPVVTLPSRQSVPRLAAGMYQAMDLTDLVVGSEGEYVQVTVRLARDEVYRRRVSGEICARKGLLYASAQAEEEWARLLTRLAARAG